MADYSLLGSFSDGGASALNGELISKLKTAEEKSKVSPIETQLETWDTELEKIDEIEVKINELLESVKVFDLFSSSNNAFEQISATTSGDSAIFDAVDIAGLNVGTVSINITQLAQKDVFQSDLILEADIENAINAGTLTIQVGDSAAIDFDTTDKTLEEIAVTINVEKGLAASVEQVGDSSYRLVIKSTDSGIDNAVTITGTASQTLGYTADGTTENAVNHTQSAQNLNATVDGVDYDVSSNSITVDGNLKITATKVGDSTISIQKDDSFILPALEEMTAKYNELLEMVNEELYDIDSSLEDKGSIKTMMVGLKDILFSTHEDDNLSLFNFGFEFDTYGKLNIDATILGEALTDNFDDIKSLFMGVSEDKGIGTQLKEYIDDMKSYQGILTAYGEHMVDRKTTLEEEKENAVKTLESKYSLMASQFAAYGAVISQMEASFGGIKMMIDQSTVSK